MSTTYDWFLRGFLRGGKAVLDLGCGAMKGALYADPDAAYLGVDANPLLVQDWPQPVKARRGRSAVIAGTLPTLPPQVDMRFDRILLLDVIEHLSKEDGLLLLDKVLVRWPEARVLVYTPWGFLEQDHGPDHPMTHRSAWVPEDFGEGWTVTEDPSNVHRSFFACR